MDKLYVLYFVTHLEKDKKWAVAELTEIYKVWCVALPSYLHEELDFKGAKKNQPEVPVMWALHRADRTKIKLSAHLQSRLPTSYSFENRWAVGLIKYADKWISHQSVFIN